MSAKSDRRNKLMVILIAVMFVLTAFAIAISAMVD